jgi:ADP-dependent NAD(P)H-hydrate dehydratase / NAD(P)H-hydrate epimerase
MKTWIHSSTLRQITGQSEALKITLLNNSLDNIDYTKLIRNHLNTNKGDFGTVGIIGGSRGMHGSMYLAGRAAMSCGAGRVVLASLDNNFAPDLIMPELLTAKPKDVLKNIEDYSVVVVGPGLGKDEDAEKILEKILDMQPAIKFIFDADALNLIAANSKWHYQFRALPNKIITPHPKEASRLINCELSQIQNTRVQSIKHLSEYYNSVTVLKGYASLLYNGKELFVNPTGNPGLSNAGQGDTLCGIIAAFIAQNMPLFDSLRLGVLIHGAAADELAVSCPGLVGILASDISTKSRELINQIVSHKKG